jgi:hypothetical protein
MSVHLPLFRSSFFTVHPLLMLWAGSSCRWDSTHVLHPLLEAARHPEGWVACFPAFRGDHAAKERHAGVFTEAVDWAFLFANNRQVLTHSPGT